MNAMKTLLAVLMVGLVSMPVMADDKDKKGNNECPVGLVSGMTMDDEFGPGTQALTNCLKKRHDVKMVVQINQFTDAQGRPYGLGNINNILADYEVTHGMLPGKDYKMVVVLHSPGGRMALKNTGVRGDGTTVSGRNPYEAAIRGLMARGVKVLFCQNTTRAFVNNPDRTAITSLPKYIDTGISATDQMIEGMEYTTAGLTSIADFQARGYQYIQP